MQTLENFITIETIVQAPLEKVWEHWTNPEHVKQWNAASNDWHTPEASNDLRVGGAFHYHMEAKDKSFGFDFNGIYTEIAPLSRIAYAIEGGRTVEIVFEETGSGIKITETFEMENMNSKEQQQSGWQSILDNFKRYTENRN